MRALITWRWLGVWLWLILPACASDAPTSRFITVRAIVPEMSGDVYLTGSLSELGPWRADGLLMSGNGGLRTATVRVLAGETAAFKITQGRWEREGLGPSGMVLANTTVEPDMDGEVTITIASWKRDVREYIADAAGAGVVGSLVYWPDIESERLEESRTISIYLPPQYEAEPETRFPVIYVQDGQNLFDPRIASTGVDWGLDEAMQSLVQEGAAEPAIIVGVWSTPARRLEYAPQGVLERITGEMAGLAGKEFPAQLRRSDAYLGFLVEELKPRVDAAFRTRPEKNSTFVMGSSMGGLISLYAMTEHPDVFGAAAGLSMHWPISVDEAVILRREADWRPAVISAFVGYLASSRLAPEAHRLWIDRGTVSLDQLYAPYQPPLTQMLASMGFAEGGSLIARIYPGADHNEAAWRARVREPMRFLLGRSSAAPDSH